jgi:hypothetical protein
VADAQIDKLCEFIHSTTESIKILGDTDLPQVRDALYGHDPIPEGCPSRAAFEEFCLRGLKGRVDEVTELIDQLEKEIFAKYSDKK